MVRRLAWWIARATTNLAMWPAIGLASEHHVFSGPSPVVRTNASRAVSDAKNRFHPVAASSRSEYEAEECVCGRAAVG